MTVKPGWARKRPTVARTPPMMEKPESGLAPEPPQSPDLGWAPGFLRQRGVVGRWVGLRTLYRHAVYWAFLLAVIVALIFIRPAPAQPEPGLLARVAFGLLVVTYMGTAIFGLVLTIRQSDKVRAGRTASRSLLLCMYVLASVTVILFSASQIGVHIEGCHTAGTVTTCKGQASRLQVLGMSAWNAANVVPALDITHSLEWRSPAQPAPPTNAIIGVSILTLRLWVTVGLLAVLKRLWDKYSGDSSSQQPPSA